MVVAITTKAPIEPDSSGKHTLFCEGYTDTSFFGVFLKKILEEKATKSDLFVIKDILVELEACKTESKISPKLTLAFKGFSVQTPRPLSYFVIIDGDDEPIQNRFDKYKNLFNANGFNIESPNTVYLRADDLAGGIFVIQGEYQGQAFRDLESLLLCVRTELSTSDEAILATFEEGCRNLGTNTPEKIDKSKLAVYLASRRLWCASFGAAIHKNYLSIPTIEELDNSAFKFLKPLIDYLQTEMP